MKSDVGGGGLASVLDAQSFLLKKLDFHHDQTCWAKQCIIDKISFFWIWRQTVKPSLPNIVDDTNAFFVG